MAQGEFFGFNVDRTSELGSELRRAADASARMTTSIRALLNEGNALAGSSVAMYVNRIGGFLGLVATETSGLERITKDAPDMAAEIDRRLVQLVSCRALINAGYVIDPGNVFLDEPPADPARVTAALERFRRGLGAAPGADGNVDELLDMNDALNGLTGTEIDAAVASLTDAELAQWNTQMTAPDITHSYGRGGVHVTQNGLPNDARIALANMLLTRAGFDAVRRIAEKLPAIHPALAHAQDGEFQLANGPLFVDGIQLETDINQGALDDCWFIAALGAVAAKDPAFIERHVIKNANGIYTVTLYRKGEPFPVTVTGDLPVDKATGLIKYAGSSKANPADELWLAIYEKAFAQYHGSYGKIEGGLGDWAFPVITGKNAVRGLVITSSLEHLSHQLKNGHVVTLGSKAFAWNWLPDWIRNSAERSITTRHIYIVKSINMEADPPTITVVNPWGSEGSDPQVVTLTQSEMQDTFVGYSVGHMP